MPSEVPRLPLGVKNFNSSSQGDTSSDSLMNLTLRKDSLAGHQASKYFISGTSTVVGEADQIVVPHDDYVSDSEGETPSFELLASDGPLWEGSIDLKSLESIERRGKAAIQDARDIVNRWKRTPRPAEPAIATSSSPPLPVVSAHLHQDSPPPSHSSQKTTNQPVPDLQAAAIQCSISTVAESPKALQIDLSPYKSSQSAKSAATTRRTSKSAEQVLESTALNNVVITAAPTTELTSPTKSSPKAKGTAKADPCLLRKISEKDPMHPNAIDLSSLQQGLLESLPSCPLCLRPFPKTYKPDKRIPHVSSCAGAHGITIESLVSLLVSEHERIARKAQKQKRAREVGLTIFDRVIKGQSAIETGKRRKIAVPNNAVLTTLQNAKAGHRKAREALKDFFASSTIRDEQETAGELQIDYEHHLIAQYDFDYEEVGCSVTQRSSRGDDHATDASDRALPSRSFGISRLAVRQDLMRKTVPSNGFFLRTTSESRAVRPRNWIEIVEQQSSESKQARRSSSSPNAQLSAHQPGMAVQEESKPVFPPSKNERIFALLSPLPAQKNSSQVTVINVPVIQIEASTPSSHLISSSGTRFVAALGEGTSSGEKSECGSPATGAAFSHANDFDDDDYDDDELFDDSFELEGSGLVLVPCSQ